MDKLDCSEVQASLPVTKWEFAKQHAIAARAWLDDTIGRCLQKHENTRSWMLDISYRCEMKHGVMGVVLRLRQCDGSWGRALK